MQVNKFISLEAVVERVHNNTGIQSIDWGEVLLYTQEFIGKFGTNKSYVNKITDGAAGNLQPLEVSNHQVELPVDCVHVNLIRDYNTKKTLTLSTDVFYQNPSLNNGSSLRLYDNVYPTQWHCTTQEDIAEDTEARQRYFNYQTQVESEVYRNLATHALNTGFPFSSYELTYQINNNYIFTSVEEMRLEVSYLAFAMDSNGLPLIPDNEYYISALAAFLQERLDYKLYRTGKLRKDIYDDSKQNYHWAIRSASSHLATPDVNEMEAIKNTYSRLIVDTRAFQSGFAFNAQRERIWRQ